MSHNRPILILVSLLVPCCCQLACHCCYHYRATRLYLMNHKCGLRACAKTSHQEQELGNCLYTCSRTEGTLSCRHAQDTHTQTTHAHAIYSYVREGVQPSVSGIRVGLVLNVVPKDVKVACVTGDGRLSGSGNLGSYLSSLVVCM